MYVDVKKLGRIPPGETPVGVEQVSAPGPVFGESQPCICRALRISRPGDMHDPVAQGARLGDGEFAVNSSSMVQGVFAALRSFGEER